MGSGSWQRSRTGGNGGYRHHCSKQSVSTPCSGLTGRVPSEGSGTGQRRRRHRHAREVWRPRSDWGSTTRPWFAASSRTPVVAPAGGVDGAAARRRGPAGGQAEDGAASDPVRDPELETPTSRPWEWNPRETASPFSAKPVSASTRAWDVDTAVRAVMEGALRRDHHPGRGGPGWRHLALGYGSGDVEPHARESRWLRDVMGVYRNPCLVAERQSGS